MELVLLLTIFYSLVSFIKGQYLDSTINLKENDHLMVIFLQFFCIQCMGKRPFYGPFPIFFL